MKLGNSNTTLVKVKLIQECDNAYQLSKFKYNSC